MEELIVLFVCLGPGKGSEMEGSGPAGINEFSEFNELNECIEFNEF